MVCCIWLCYGRVVISLLREAWTIAIEALSWMQMRRLSESMAFDRTVRQLGVKDADALRLARLLVFETSKRRNFLDRFINLVLRPRVLSEFELGVQAFLRLYVYETRFAHGWKQVNVKEAENIAGLGRTILGWQKLLPVEPVLGFLLTSEYESAVAGVDDVERVGLEFFHPSWFVQYCFRIFGRSFSLKLLAADNEVRPTYVRLNTLRTCEAEILRELEREGVNVVKETGLPFVYRVVSSRVPLAVCECYRRGLFFVQDKASCFAALAAGVKGGMRVYDVCAAPGAKTTFLGELMENDGTVFSFDYSVRRMGSWKRAVERMGVSVAVPVVCDARIGLPVADNADVVVLDPPCTGSGAFGKTPSARWRLSTGSVDRMATLQWQMIEACAMKVRTGGILIYSTCSVLVEEDEFVVERFLKRHPEFELEKIEPDGVGVGGLRGLDLCRRLWPHLDGCNGFFVAKLKKML